MKIKNFSVTKFTNEAGSSYVDITLPTLTTGARVTHAKLKLKINAVTLSENSKVTVNYSIPGEDGSGWGNLDCIKALKSGDIIYLDITDELHNAYTKNKQVIRLEFVYDNASDAISFDDITDENFDVDALPLTEFQSNGSSHEINFGKAGKSSIDLATGILSLTHVDTTNDNNVLPLSITHNYNSNRNDQNTFLDNHKLNSHCGNGWNLNVQQYLQRVADNTGENTTLKFKYLDANSKVQNIEEKYYYLDADNKKHFVSRNDITVNLDGQYKYNDKDIHTYLESNGIKLTSSIKDIKNANLLDIEPEELSQTRNQLKQLKEAKEELEFSIDSNSMQLGVLALTKEALDTQLFNQKDIFNTTKEDLKLQLQIEKLKYTIISRNRNFKLTPENEEQGYTKEYIGNKSFNKEMVNEIDDYYNYEKKFATGTGDHIMQVNDVEVAKNILFDESNLIYSLGFNRQGDERGSLYQQCRDNQVSEYIYNTQIREKDFEKLISSLLSQYGDSNSITMNSSDIYQRFVSSMNKHYDGRYIGVGDYNYFPDWIPPLIAFSMDSSDTSTSLNFSLSEKDILNLDVQIKNLLHSTTKCNKQLSEYKDEITKLEHQLDLYEMQLPVHYLYNDNTIYGFAKASKEDENLFRLVLIADQYNNAIQINYEDFDNNKIVSITDSADKTILFDYDQNDLLTSIADSRDRKIKFEYDANHLIKITYHDGKSSQYCYNENQLKDVIDQTGLGAVFTYTDNKVTKVQAITTLDSLKYNNTKFKTDINYAELTQYAIPDQSITFEYYDCQTTYVTNAQGKKIVYVFNEYGQVINVYEQSESKISNKNVAQVKEYTYSSNKLAETTSILPYSINYLENTCFGTGKTCCVTENIPTLYLGQIECGVPCDSELMNTRFINRDKHKFTDNTASVHVAMDQIYIDKLNTDHVENLVLSGWAKADSAFVCNPDHNERFGEDEPIEYSNYVQQRKFELRIELKYVGEDKPQVLTKQFNWRNTKWQYCALPIKLKPDAAIESITCHFDYSNNTHTADVEFSDLQLREGTCEAKRYDDANHLVKSENHLTYTEYAYDADDNLIKETTRYIHKPEKAYTTTYEYNQNKKLIKKIAYNGIITENVYDDKGICIKTLTYHQDDPTSKFYSEKVVDEKGNTTAATNDLGEVTTNYEYVAGTGIVAAETDQDQNKVAYGYDTNDTLVACSSTVNNEVNTNLYGYTLSFLTALQHNDFAYNYEYDGQGRLNKVLVADQEYLTKTYADKAETTEYKNGATYQQTFNNDGNVTAVEYNGTPIIENVYDSVGSLIQTTDTSNGTAEVHQYFYDKYRTQDQEATTQHGMAVNFADTLDADTRQVTNHKITFGETTYNYAYHYNDDLNAKLTQVTLPNGKIQTITYDKLGRTAGINQASHTRLFHYLKSGDHATNLVSSIWYGQNNAINENLTYQYDYKGNITAVQENGKMVCRYAYDALSRLIREDNKALQKTVTYAYDAGGNIIYRTEYPFTLKETAYLENGVAFPYAYPANGWRDQLLSYNGEQCVYDTLGNPTIYRGKTLQWSHGRQLDAYSDVATYTYNTNGIRTSKTVHGSTTKFYLHGDQIIVQDNGNKMFFHYGVDGVNGFTLKLSDLVVQHYTYKKNLQGDIIGIYNENNTLICKYVYDAWGNHKILVLNNGKYETLSNTETTTNANIATVNPFRYRGYYFDTETGLYYLNSRYYDPETGHFISADSLDNIDSNNINGFNLYMYCADNPTMNVDNNGTAWWNPFSWNWKKIGETIATALAVTASVAAVVGGVALTIVSVGTLSNVGSALIGAGVGSLIGGIQSQTSGGSFWAGYLGGAITGGLTAGLGAFLGIGGALAGGFLGNFTGTVVTDAINGVNMNSNYFINLFADSLLSGIVAMGGKQLGNIIDILKAPGYRDIYMTFVICLEFMSVDIFNKSKRFLTGLADFLREKFSYFFRG